MDYYHDDIPCKQHSREKHDEEPWLGRVLCIDPMGNAFYRPYTKQDAACNEAEAARKAMLPEAVCSKKKKVR